MAVDDALHAQATRHGAIGLSLQAGGLGVRVPFAPLTFPQFRGLQIPSKVPDADDFSLVLQLVLQFGSSEGFLQSLERLSRGRGQPSR